MTVDETIATPGYSPEEQERLNAEYSFVFCYHTEEFVDEISAAVQDCDTVAFEYVGFDSDDERQRWDARLTTYVSDTVTEQLSTEVEAELDASAAGAYLKGVLAKLRGSNKKIVTLDMNVDNPNYPLVEEWWVAEKDYYRIVKDGSPVQEIRQASTALLRTAVTSFPLREAVMANQLKALGHSPGKIGVVTGIIHTPVEEELSSIAETTKTVIGPAIAEGTEVVDYDDFDLAILQARTNGIENVDGMLLDRAILTDVIRGYDIDLGNNTARELVRSVPDEQVGEVLHAIDEIHAKHATQSKGVFRWMLSKDEVTHALQKVWSAIPENPTAIRRITKH